jgi:hypothetical protein
MKAKYKISKNNQLIIDLGKEILRPKGEFVVGSNNQLTYIIKEPKDWRLVRGVPERINLKGIWSISKDHDLVFSLQKTRTQSEKDRLVLKTQLKDAKSASLVFLFATEGKTKTHALRLLELKGKWQADKSNRLQFLVKKLNTNSGVLTFQGAWQLKNNNIVYTYKEAALKTKKKRTNTLYFKGYWDIARRNRLTYILDIKNNTSFTFKAYLETPSLIGKRGVIKYRIGFGLKGSKLFKSEIITFYGVWKFSRVTGLSYEMDYGQQKIKAIRFRAFVRVQKKNKITFGLRSREGNNLGINLEFSRSFLKDKASWFVRLFAEGENRGVKAGVEIPW